MVHDHIYIFDLFTNSIEQLEKFKASMVDDLNFYLQRPNANKAYLDIKQKQIASIEGVVEMFTNVYNTLNELNNQLQKAVDAKEDKIFKLEACAIYYGISQFELLMFTSRQSENIANLLKRCFTEKWCQIPLRFQDVIDEQKFTAIQDQVKIAINKNGQITYTTPASPQIKTVLEPVFNWSHLKTP